MRISDWSSDVCSSDLRIDALRLGAEYQFIGKRYNDADNKVLIGGYGLYNLTAAYDFSKQVGVQVRWNNLFNKDYTNVYGYNMPGSNVFVTFSFRSEEHTSELQSLMRISYAVFCLKKKKYKTS